ncbi:MAG: hypothetical protein JWQ87_1472 [Candidatus Sulfotelmatobacter sp.]|nr:hypothetical protein [Candidatus Sulfotelmatobacter sp.]
MTSSQPESTVPDLAAIWEEARRLHPIYSELAREFAIDLTACHALEAAELSPDADTVKQAQQWLDEMDERLQVHQLRQFLQTSSVVSPEGLIALLQHFLTKTTRTDAMRDKIDFLLVQYFSQGAPTDLDDDSADTAFVAQGLEPVLGKVDIKSPVWLNALDRVLEAARRCRSLDELLHGGVLEQGRKAKAQAGDLFYLPVALIAFTRFGYLMRRVFFRLMLADLNRILDGLTELEEQRVETIDCRRAQFSAQEPILRLRMICQSWKVMFQAEYSSGQPLRMLVDLRASVEAALGQGSTSGDEGSAGRSGAKAKAARAASAGASVSTSGKAYGAQAKTTADALPVVTADVAEFEVAAATPEWNPDSDGHKK